MWRPLLGRWRPGDGFFEVFFLKGFRVWGLRLKGLGFKALGLGLWSSGFESTSSKVSLIQGHKLGKQQRWRVPRVWFWVNTVESERSWSESTSCEKTIQLKCLSFTTSAPQRCGAGIAPCSRSLTRFMPFWAPLKHLKQARVLCNMIMTKVIRGNARSKRTL